MSPKEQEIALQANASEGNELNWFVNGRFLGSQNSNQKIWWQPSLGEHLIVITDEIYAELTYEGEHVSIASVPGMKERTIFLHGMSKAWAMTGFRAGYSCAPADLTEAMMKIHQYTMLCAPILSQAAAEEALKDPWIQRRMQQD